MSQRNMNDVENLVQNAAGVVNQVLRDTVMPVVNQVVPAVNEALKEVNVENVKKTQKTREKPVVKLENVTLQHTNMDEEIPPSPPVTIPSAPVDLIAPSLLDPAFEHALEQVKARVGVSEVTAQSLMLIVKYAMEVVELVDLKGSEQRELALRLVRRVVQDAPISDEKEQLCLDMIDSGAVGQTIDLVIDATNGHVNVNQIARVAENCCFTFLSSRKRKNRVKK
jgi:hypothetical protein